MVESSVGTRCQILAAFKPRRPSGCSSWNSFQVGRCNEEPSRRTAQALFKLSCMSGSRMRSIAMAVQYRTTSQAAMLCMWSGV